MVPPDSDKHLRPVPEVLERIRALDAHPLTVARAPGDRMAAVCRHFSLMLCAILRELGVPARARCGFGAYFTPGKFEDHWVCEYWNAGTALRERKNKCLSVNASDKHKRG